MSYAQKALKGVIFTFLFTSLAAALGYVMRIVLARNLSVVEYGLFYAIFSFFGVVGYFRHWGMGEALVKHVTGFLVKNDEQRLANTVKTVLLFLLCTGVILLLLVIPLADWLAAHYFHVAGAGILLTLFAVAFFFKAPKELGRFILQGYQRMFGYASLQLLENVLLFLAVILLLQWNTTALTPVLAYLFTFAVLTPLNLYISTKGKKIWTTRYHYDKKLFRKLWKYGFAIMIAGLASMVYLYTDILVLTYFRDLAEVGIYSVAVVTVMMLTYVFRPFESVLFPMISELWARKRLKDLTRGLRLVHAFMFMAVLPVGFAFIAFPDDVLGLIFGGEYAAGAQVLQILVVAVFFLLIALLNLSVLNAIGKPEIGRNLGLYAAIANLVLNLVFIPMFGMLAAAGSTLLTYAFLFVFSSFAVTKHLGKVLPWGRWLATILAGCAMLAILFSLKIWVFASAALVVKAVATLGIAGLCYAGFLFLFRAVTMTDYHYLKNTLWNTVRDVMKKKASGPAS